MAPAGCIPAQIFTKANNFNIYLANRQWQLIKPFFMAHSIGWPTQSCHLPRPHPKPTPPQTTMDGRMWVWVFMLSCGLGFILNYYYYYFPGRGGSCSRWSVLWLRAVLNLNTVSRFGSPPSATRRTKSSCQMVLRLLGHPIKLGKPEDNYLYSITRKDEI